MLLDVDMTPNNVCFDKLNLIQDGGILSITTVPLKEMLIMTFLLNTSMLIVMCDEYTSR